MEHANLVTKLDEEIREKQEQIDKNNELLRRGCEAIARLDKIISGWRKP